MITWGDFDFAPAGIVLVSLAGLANAVTMTLAYYGRVIPSRFLPSALCRREERSCRTVLRTPYARALGVPNSLLGTVYYLGMSAGVICLPRLPWVLYGLLMAATVAFSFGIYLIYALRVRLRVGCPLCYLAHFLNTALLLLSLELLISRR